jgi:uncharacterized membrane protein
LPVANSGASEVVTNLLAAAVVFICLHRVVSGTGLRARIVRRIGEESYGRLFQLASIGSLVWLGFAYAGANHGVVVTGLWVAHPLLRPLQLAVQPLAMLLIVAGLTTSNPGTFRQEAAVDRSDLVRGIVRITRHPFLWGVALFAAGHLVASPTPRNLVLFGTLVFVSLTGTLSIDAKRQRALGAKWAAFAARTSNVPLAAILRRRQRLALGEVGWIRIMAAGALALALVLLHGTLFGVPALPG